MSEPTDWIKEASEVGTDLRRAIREAHELLRDLRDTRREVEQLCRQATREVQEEAAKIFKACFDEELNSYTNSLSDMSVSAMDRLSNSLAEEMERAVRTLMRTSTEAIERVAASKGDATGPLHI